jgi:hypothetical protein
MEHDACVRAKPAGDAAPAAALPDVESPLGPAEALQRLATASRRGRLPGFHNHAEPGGVLFSVAAFGHPFDGVLNARVDSGSAATMRLLFRWQVPSRLPILFGVALAATVWPGVYFMDQLMIQAAPGWREAVPTWWWYLPLTLASIPWLVRSVWHRTRVSVQASSLEAIEKIAREIDGRVIGAPDTAQATPR